jgi:hypothetical protein
LNSFPKSPIATEFHKAELNYEVSPDDYLHGPNPPKPIPSLQRLNRSGQAR